MTTLRDLLSADVVAAAKLVLGCRLRTSFGGEPTELQICEVEAYAGPDDEASHAYRGPTPGNRSMFAEPGTLYVYRSYGIHWCANVVAGPQGRGNAILLRGGVATEGRPAMVRRRGRTDHLADGPGKLTQALGIDGSHDGTYLLDGPVQLRPGIPPTSIRATPRIGLTKATEHLWRFVAS